MPQLPHLRENNVNIGFLEDSQYAKLVGGQSYDSALLSSGRPMAGESELLTGQIEAQRVIRLDLSTTKNSNRRELSRPMHFTTVIRLSAGQERSRCIANLAILLAMRAT
jgi:hypothetical protein